MAVAGGGQGKGVCCNAAMTSGVGSGMRTGRAVQRMAVSMVRSGQMAESMAA